MTAGPRRARCSAPSAATTALRGRPGLLAQMRRRILVLRHRFWSVVTGADVPLNSQIGGGLLLPHPNGIVIHPEAVIGPNCLLFQQVTIGATQGGVPRIGGHVDIGAGAEGPRADHDRRPCPGRRERGGHARRSRGQHRRWYPGPGSETIYMRGNSVLKRPRGSGPPGFWTEKSAHRSATLFLHMGMSPPRHDDNDYETNRDIGDPCHARIY